MANEDNIHRSAKLDTTITDLKCIGTLLSHIDMEHDIDPNTLASIGYMIERTADKAIDLLSDGGAS